jgi:hypothetical protein
MHSTRIQKSISQSGENNSSYKYFKIKVKLGHVTRRKYLPMWLPIRAKTVHEAIAIARNHGGVKRDHQNWCLEIPTEISFQEYLQLERETYNDLYWEGETRNRLDLFNDRLIDEDDEYLSNDDFHKKQRSKERKLSNKSEYLSRKCKIEQKIWRHIEEADKSLAYENE